MKIGIDLGGTKIALLALAADGAVLAERRIATPQGDYHATVQLIARLITDVERTLGRRSDTIGIGTPGAISPVTGLIKNANSTCLNGKPLKRDIECSLDRAVMLANDADCFALSEATDGAAAGAGIVFGVILGTGTGGGIVVRGGLLQGLNAIAGEWGHNPLPWPKPDESPGPPCYCGKYGCIETFLSGPGMAREHMVRTGARLAPAEIAARAAAHEVDAQATLDLYYNRLARALASIINVLDPDIIVLGGGLSKLTSLYSEIPARWGDHIFSDHVATRLMAPRYGDASGVRGAAWLGL